MSENVFAFSNLEICLAGIAGGLFLIQFFYCLVTYARPLRAAKKVDGMERASTNRDIKPVSVIVYANGDPEDLQRNLTAFLTQNYPDYEVIVVNDGSNADCEDVLKLFSKDYKNLYYTYVPVNTQYLSHKKLALTMGIKAAKHNLLLFTEADCRPLGPEWIKAMAGTYDHETEIILGICTYRHTKRFFHKLIAYDNLMNSLQMISSALSHHPYTGNGRNLSYRKELFFAHKGYSESLYLHAGSDDLFINQAATGSNTKVQYSANALIEMDRIKDPGFWKEMKVTRAATGRYYKGNSLLFYSMDNYSNLLFHLTAVAAFVTGVFGNWMVSILAGLLLILRFTAKAVVIRKSALLLRQKPLTAWLPILEIVQPAYNTYIRIYRLFKGRKDFTAKV